MIKQPLALFVLGAPGVGKTTAVHSMMSKLDPFGTAFLLQKPKWTVCPTQFAAAGHYTGGVFDGADTVGYADVNATLDAMANNLQSWAPRYLVFDGDRFSHTGVLDKLNAMGIETVAALLTTTADTLAQRRNQRGSNQNPAWMRGRETKAARFAQAPQHRASVELESSGDVGKMLLDLVEGM